MFSKPGINHLISLALGMSLGAMWIILWITQTDLGLLLEINIGFLIMSYMLHFCSWNLASKRLSILAGAMGTSHSHLELLKIVLSSNFLAYITPTYLGGEPLKIYLLHRAGHQWGESTTIVITDRLLDGLVLLMLGSGVLILAGAHFSEFLVIGIGFGILTGAVLMAAVLAQRHSLGFSNWISKLLAKLRMDSQRISSISSRIHSELQSFGNGFSKLRANKLHLLECTAAVLGFWMCEFSIPYVISLGLGIVPDWKLLFAAQAIIAMAFFLAITPGGAGIIETLALALFSVSIPQRALGLVILIWRMISFYTDLLVGGILGLRISQEFWGSSIRGHKRAYIHTYFHHPRSPKPP